jgi:hypothetical protein
VGETPAASRNNPSKTVKLRRNRNDIAYPFILILS